MDCVSAKLIGLIRSRPFLLIVRFLAALAILVFGEMAEDVRNREGLRWDIPILRFIHSYATPSRDAVMVFVTRLGSMWVVVPCGVGVTLLLLYLKRPRDARFFAVAVGGTAILSFVAKWFFGRDRPHLWQSPAPESDYGFPSGHALGTMGVVVALTCLVWPTRWRWPVLIGGGLFALLIGLTRLYVGVHFPSDVVAGWSAAVAWVIGVYLTMQAQELPGRGKTHLIQALKAVGKSLKRELAVYQCVLRDPRTPTLAKVLLGLAIGYLLLPFDLIPDFIPVLGHLDDVIIVPALVSIALTMIPQQIIEDCRTKAHTGDKEEA